MVSAVHQCESAIGTHMSHEPHEQYENAKVNIMCVYLPSSCLPTLSLSTHPTLLTLMRIFCPCSVSHNIKGGIQTSTPYCLK